MCCRKQYWRETLNRPQAQEIPPPKTYNVSPEGVNVQDGSFVYEKGSLAIGASENALSLSHFYIGGHQTINKVRALGPRWGVNYDIYIFDKKHMSIFGKRTKKRYTLGDTVKFKVSGADMNKKTIDYDIV